MIDASSTGACFGRVLVARSRDRSQTGLQRVEAQRFASGPSSAGIARGLIEAEVAAQPRRGLGASSAGIARGLIEARYGRSPATRRQGHPRELPAASLKLPPRTESFRQVRRHPRELPAASLKHLAATVPKRRAPSSSAGIARGLIEACQTDARAMFAGQRESSAGIARGLIEARCKPPPHRRERAVIRGNCPRPH